MAGAALCLGALIATPARADAVPGASLPLSTLAAHPGWHKLLHYEATGWPATLRSAIHSPGFFLDPAHGPTDPEAELRATLSALQQPAGAQPDTHAQCRFPARALWLQRQLGTALTLPALPCPRWDAWTRQHRITSVSIVLATGYLGNPASYYGHTLLKFNTADTPAGSTLRDPTINYGAILTGADDPLTYMVKGVFGGYDGGFSEIDYYFHRSQYGEQELRDLWEYELALSPDEVQYVAAHAWEVLGQEYQYFFFRRNCAFRMAELVQLLDGVDLIPAHRPWTIPQSVLQKAAQSTRPDGTPLVRRVHHEPSRQSRFYAGYLALSDDERSAFRSLALDARPVETSSLTHLPLPSQHAVLDTLIDYEQFLADPKARAAGLATPRYTAALRTRYRLPPGPASQPKVAVPPPHDGRRPGWLQAGVVHHESRQSPFVRVRMAYYDALDGDQGHVPNAGLTMFDLRVRADGTRVRLDQLELIAIESVNPGVTGLPGDRGEAWRLRLGMEPAVPGCHSDCVTPRAQGDWGTGRQLSRSLYGLVMVGGAAQGSIQGHGIGFGRLTGELMARPAAGWTARLAHEMRWPVDGTQPAHSVSRAELRYAPAVNWDVRVRHERSSAAPGGGVTWLGVGGYW